MTDLAISGGPSPSSPRIVKVRGISAVALSVLMAVSGVTGADNVVIEVRAGAHPVARLQADSCSAAALARLLDRPAWLLAVGAAVRGGVVARVWALVPAAEGEGRANGLAPEDPVFAIPLQLIILRDADRAHPDDVVAEVRTILRSVCRRRRAA